MELWGRSLKAKTRVSPRAILKQCDSLLRHFTIDLGMRGVIEVHLAEEFKAPSEK